MANKKVSQLTSKPSVLVTDLFPIADPSTGQLYKTTISDLGTAIGSGVSSVNGLVGAVVLDTDDIQELASPTNKWFTDTRARAALSASSPLAYNSGTGVFSIPAATSSQNGYLTSTDWSTFNGKLDPSTAASTYVPYTGATGAVNLGSNNITAGIAIVNQVKAAGSGGLSLNSNNGTQVANLGAGGGANITFYGGLTGTVATFLNTNSGIALGITQSGSTGDGIKITHSAGRAFNLQSSGSGYGVLINNETASTSAPFTIQKQGADKITFTDAGAGSFASSLTASSFVKSGGTSSQYLMADGSVSTLTNPVTGTGTSGIVAKFNGTSTITDSIIYDNGTRISIGADVTTSNKFTAVASTTSSYAVVAQASGAANGFWATLSGSGEIFRGQTSGGSYFIINNGGNAFLNGNLNVGDFSSTSYRLNVVGTANFTGALTGTSATFSTTIADYAMSVSNVLDSSQGLLVRATDNDGDLYLLRLQSSNGATSQTWVDRFTVAKSGAATFLSSVTATSILLNGSAVSILADGIKINRDPSTTSSAIFNANGGGANIISNSGSTSSFTPITFRASDNTTTNELMRITGTGNVGIGTTSPTVVSGFTDLTIDGSSGSFIDLRYNGSNNGRFVSSAGIVGLQSLSTTPLTLSTNGSERMRITSAGNVGIGTSSVSAAGTQIVTEIYASQYGTLRLSAAGTVQGEFTANNQSNWLFAGTTTNHHFTFGTNNTERMRITSGGNVGIGTTSPGAKLTVNSGTTSGFSFQVSGTSTFDFVGNAKRLAIFSLDGGDGTGIQLGYDATANTGIIAGSTNGTGAGIDFYTYSGSAWANKMRISASGITRSLRLQVGAAGISAGNYCEIGNDDNVGYIDTVRAVNSGDFHFRFDGTSRATINRSTGVYVATSDITKKKDLEESKIGLSEVMQLKPTLYRMKTDETKGEKELGFIAQDVKRIIPSAYQESGDFIGLNFNPIVAALTKAVQELKAELDTLKNK
jgi:hypothetical protein